MIALRLKNYSIEEVRTSTQKKVYPLQKTVSLFLTATLLLITSSWSWAEFTTKAGTVTLVIGNATVERGTPAEVKPVHFRDPVYVQDSITTGEESFVRVLMGRKALVTVSEMSVLTITEDLHQATINLNSGFIGLSVARKRMDDGEYIEIRTPHAVAAVRGTKVIAEVPTPNITRVTVIEGHVDVYSHSRPNQIISVSTRQSVETTLTAPSRIQTLSPNVLEKKKQQLNPPTEPAKNSSVLDRIVKKQIGEASQIAQNLTSGDMGDTSGGNQTKVADANNLESNADFEPSDDSPKSNSPNSEKSGSPATGSAKVTSNTSTSQGSKPATQFSSERSQPGGAASKAPAPKVAAPKVAAPKVAAPKVAAPRIAAPKVAKPRVAAPRVAAPKVAKPRVAKPRVAKPWVAKQKTIKSKKGAWWRAQQKKRK